MSGIKKQKGFTLIELLVVIAIISLLVSILLPSLNQAREVARGVVCGTNLRNQGQVLNLLVNDTDGVYPFTNYNFPQSWKCFLYPYLDLPLISQNAVVKYGSPSPMNDTIFDCPSNTYLSGVSGTYKGDCRNDYGVAYNYLFAFMASYSNRGTNAYNMKLSKQKAFTKPLHEIAVTADYNSERYPTQDAIFYASLPMYTSDDKGTLGVGHNGEANVLYLDGRVDIGNTEVVELNDFLPGWPCW